MLPDPGPAPMVFDNPGVALPEQQMLQTRNVNGVYAYSVGLRTATTSSRAGSSRPATSTSPRTC
jgi:hypothetical protein